ncbi:hypothetical protein ABPG75_004425 [Micractinium tetrahymenae]
MAVIAQRLDAAVAAVVASEPFDQRGRPPGAGGGGPVRPRSASQPHPQPRTPRRAGTPPPADGAGSQRLTAAEEEQLVQLLLRLAASSPASSSWEALAAALGAQPSSAAEQQSTEEPGSAAEVGGSTAEQQAAAELSSTAEAGGSAAAPGSSSSSAAPTDAAQRLARRAVGLLGSLAAGQLAPSASECRALHCLLACTSSAAEGLPPGTHIPHGVLLGACRQGLEWNRRRRSSAASGVWFRSGLGRRRLAGGKLSSSRISRGTHHALPCPPRPADPAPLWHLFDLRPRGAAAAHDAGMWLKLTDWRWAAQYSRPPCCAHRSGSRNGQRHGHGQQNHHHRHARPRPAAGCEGLQALQAVEARIQQLQDQVAELQAALAAAQQAAVTAAEQQAHADRHQVLAEPRPANELPPAAHDMAHDSPVIAAAPPTPAGRLSAAAAHTAERALSSHPADGGGSGRGPLHRRRGFVMFFFASLLLLTN